MIPPAAAAMPPDTRPPARTTERASSSPTNPSWWADSVAAVADRDARRDLDDGVGEPSSGEHGLAPGPPRRRRQRRHLVTYVAGLVSAEIVEARRSPSLPILPAGRATGDYLA